MIEKKKREREKNRRNKLECFVVFFIFKNTRLPANIRLIFARFWYFIGGGSGAEASGSNHKVLSLVTLVGAKAV